MSVKELLNNGHFGLLAKPVKDYEDYIVTSLGLIWSKKSKMFLKPVFDGYSHTYFCVSLCKNKIRKSFFVHRLVARAFLENIENKKYVDHINGNRTNNNINNLRFATSSENNINKNMHKNNKLRVKGISKHSNSYKAHITKDGKTQTKTYKTLDEAKAWREQKELELHKEYARKD